MKHIRTVGVALAFTMTAAGTAAAAMWGATGHEIVGEVAAASLPTDMPAFFRDAAPQLRWLDPEPDRWRDRDAPAMDEAFKYDHYIDLENVPAGALDARDRFTYLEALFAAGLKKPQQTAGFLPYRILEMQERVTNGFARWRRAEGEQERRWIEARIINDAGILGHYVADGSNPHHTTIHFNGWAKGAANPRGFATAHDIHWRFESLFVDAHVTVSDVAAAVPPGTEAIPDVRQGIMAYLQATHAQVVPLYQIEQKVGFPGDSAAAAPAAKAFVVDRLAAGAEMLRALWYTAWVDSEAVARRSERR